MAASFPIVVGIPIIATVLFLLLQPDSVVFRTSIFIKADPEDVFHSVKSPLQLPRFHTDILTSSVLTQVTDKNGVFNWEIFVTEALAPLLGNVSIIVNEKADPVSLNLHYDYDANAYLVLQFDGAVSVNIKTGARAGVQGTACVFDWTGRMPWIIKKIKGDSVTESILHFAKNIKKVIEGRKKQPQATKQAKKPAKKITQ